MSGPGSADRSPILPAGRAGADKLSAQKEAVSRASILSLMSDFPVAFMVLNGDRQIVYFNERSRDLMGSLADSPYGLRPGEAFSCLHANDGIDGCGTGPFCRYCGAARSLAAALSGLFESAECTIERSRTKRLDQLDLLIWTKPLDLADVRFFLFAAIDISERKRMEALERVFLHDLMNTAGSLSSLMNLIDPTDASFSEYFPLAKDASEQLVDEIAAHRTLSDAENGRLHTEVGVLQSSDPAAFIAEIYRKIAESRGIAFVLSLPGDAPLIMTDRVLLRRVLANLLKNAIEASGPGQTVRLSLEIAAGTAVYRVTNESVLSEEIRAQLFHRSFSTKGRGRGIGTYAARLFVEDFLGGRIDVSSGPGAGTTFSVALPLPF